jgi:hypothetical protein
LISPNKEETMPPGDLLVLVGFILALVLFWQIARMSPPKSEESQLQDLYELQRMQQELEQMLQAAREREARERERLASPEFTLLRASEDNAGATLLRAVQGGAQKVDKTSLLRSVSSENRADRNDDEETDVK